MTATSISTPARKDLGGVLAGLSLLAVTALWTANGGVQDLGTDPFDATGRLTGLLASDLLLIQVLLMARIPLVERAFGQDRLARWHRWSGFTSFWLMVAHIVLITIGYAAPVRENVFRELWDLVVGEPGMLLAAAGTLALVMVVVTSIRAARRKLRYESWHLLHLYAYLGVGLALPHQLWTGSDFLSSPLATAYWWTLYAVSAGAVLVYRVALPAWRNWRHRLVVSRVVPEGPGLTSVYLTGRSLGTLPVRAGQFFQWRFLDGPGWTRANPYSLSATPHGHELRITVKDLGDGSSRVGTLRPGTRALIEGPYGKLTGEPFRGGPVTLLACGIGVTPLLSLLGDLPYRPGEATLIYRARGEADTAFRAELDWFATQRSVKIIYLYGARAARPSFLPAQYADHADADALRQLAPAVARSHVYICGPDAWTQAAHAAARAAGVPADRLHTELFAWEGTIMRRITLWLLSTVAAVVLLFSYRTSTGGSAVAASTSISTPATTSTGAATSASASTGSTSTGSKTYTGSSASTRWGDVQVSITVTDGKITDVAVPVYPTGNGRDQEINAYALPILRQETLQKQSAGIDTVSGATVTSDGYLQSLQSALDAANL